MSEVQYPDLFPIESVKQIVTIVKSGTIKEQVSPFAFHVWVIQGYAQKQVLGTPDGGASIMTTQKSASLESALSMLELLASDEPKTQASVDWSLILPYLFQLLKDVLDDLLKD